MGSRGPGVAGVLATVLFCGVQGATAQTPVDGRIVRVVYDVIFDDAGPRGSTWGFHLAHMKDGRYCVRLGNPGRLNLATIEKVGDICFAGIPGAVERSKESTTRSLDAREKGKWINVSTYQKGSIARAGDDITLVINTCTRPEGDADYRCLPNSYVVRMTGDTCTATVTLSDSRSRAGKTTCEHYAAK